MSMALATPTRSQTHKAARKPAVLPPVASVPLRRPAQSRASAPGRAPCTCGGQCPRCSGAGQSAGAPVVFAKLRVEPSATPAEAEADRFADSVMSGRSPAKPDRPRPDGGIARSASPKGGAESGIALPPQAAQSFSNLGSGQPLARSEQSFFEPRLGMDLSRVRVYTNAQAQGLNEDLDARAMTRGTDILFNSGQYQPNSPTGRKLLAHELAHVAQQDGNAGSGRIQRAMKFEFQVKRNRVFGWDGDQRIWPLQRKFGPADFLVQGASGARMESETHGQLEFETKWERKFSKLAPQVIEAMEMTKQVDALPKDVTVGGHKFRKLPTDPANPLDTSPLHGRNWSIPRGKSFENNHATETRGPRPDATHPDRALKGRQGLLVDVADPTWNAYIQTSESMEIDQYESYLRQYEFNRFDARKPVLGADGKPHRSPPDTKAFPGTAGIAQTVVSAADSILRSISRSSPPGTDTNSLRSYLQLVVHMILRGQFPAASPMFKPSKFTFALMSRTDLGRIYADVLETNERKLFDRFVANAESLLLGPLGLDGADRFFVHGQGSKNNKGVNPKIIDWLTGLTKGVDGLSSRTPANKGRISAAMGRFGIDTAGKHKGLARFEVRKTPGNSARADNWGQFVLTQFLIASQSRDRPNDRGETGLTFR